GTDRCLWRDAEQRRRAPRRIRRNGAPCLRAQPADAAARTELRRAAAVRTRSDRRARRARGHPHGLNRTKLMVERGITISNKLRLHARASAKLVQLLQGFRCNAFLVHRGREVNAKSIMGVMMLAAGIGTPIVLRTEGADEEAALVAMADLFERKFDEGA